MFSFALRECIGLSAAMAVAVAATADSPRRVVEYLPKHQVVSVDVHHEPLDEIRLAWWGQLLRASAEQQLFMELSHRQFVQDHNNLLDRIAPDHMALGVEVNNVAASEGYASRAYLSSLRRFNESSRRVRNAMVALEHDFIERIQPVLTPEQRENLDVLRQESIRRNWLAIIDFPRWTNVELRRIWLTSHAFDVASADERSQVHAILIEYETRLTQLTRSLAETAGRTHERRAALFVSRAEGAITAAETRERSQRFLRQAAEPADAIRLLHETTLDRLKNVLPVAAWALLEADAKRAAFSEIYPDSTSLAPLFAALLDDATDDADSLAHVASLQDAYTTAMQQKNRELERMCIEWGQRNAEGVNGYQRQYFPDAIRPLLIDRREMSKRWLQTLHDQLGAATLQRVKEFIPPVLLQE